jgi:uncharacterized glyoxalase superfamily protein PhnB
VQPIIAELTVEDVEVSILWYRELGFSVELEGLRDEDGLQWVSLAHDGRSVWLLRADMSTQAAAHPPRTTFYLAVPDADAMFSQLEMRDVTTDSAPQNQWYGQREFALKDPDGFRWVINQPIPPEECPPPPTGGAGFPGSLI